MSNEFAPSANTSSIAAQPIFCAAQPLKETRHEPDQAQCDTDQRPPARHRRLEPGLGAVRPARSDLDREIHGDGHAPDRLGRARAEGDRVHRDRGGRVVHPHVCARHAAPHPQGAGAGRHQGRDHRRAAGGQRAGHSLQQPGRADPAGGMGGRAARKSGRRATCRLSPTASTQPTRGRHTMHFLDDSLLPENQQPLVIQVAPYGPEFLPGDSDDIPVTMDQQVQKAVDCWNAGATVLHVHVREKDGKGSKRLSMFNELLTRLRAAVPDMILQVGGSISFAPEGEGEVAKWLSDDTRHMLAELVPTPDQVTIAINSNQMNVVEQMCDADIRGTSLAEPANYRAYREMTIPAGPDWVEEHIRRLSANGIQTHFQLANITQLETVERMMRRGTCNVPLILTWVAIGGGFDAPNIYNLANFVRAVPDGAVLTLETSMLNVLPINMMAIAMGLHVRCGIADNIWTQDRKSKMSSIRQVEQLVRISREFGRPVANAREARAIYRIGEFYHDADETLARNGFAPNRKAGERGMSL